MSQQLADFGPEVYWELSRYWLSPKANEIVDRYEALIGEDALDYGPGHIVFADPNAEDNHIESCLKYCERVDELLAEGQRTREEIELAEACLRELLAVPEFERLNHYYQIESIPDDLKYHDEQGQAEMLEELRIRREMTPSYIPQNERS
ncbi:MAG: hypothetical protein EOP84_23610 [Verrucomicrobiaceae bacterium]|nr:MAG: hypothetical protein EOP84_23610 [Verrucomicrobiaceae bacterium]